MKKSMTALLMLLIINVCAVDAGQTGGFDLERLSAKGRAAYEKLFTAGIFRIGAIGDMGSTSDEEVALINLLEEQDAVAALKSLVSSGSHEGGLYGLLGLSIKDGGEFELAVDIYDG